MSWGKGAALAGEGEGERGTLSGLVGGRVGMNLSGVQSASGVDATIGAERGT